MSTLALEPQAPEDDDGHDGHDTPQRPETDVWPGWTGLRVGIDHTQHAGHRNREAKR